jgi:hypothetical protein
VDGGKPGFLDLLTDAVWTVWTLWRVFRRVIFVVTFVVTLERFAQATPGNRGARVRIIGKAAKTIG